MAVSVSVIRRRIEDDSTSTKSTYVVQPTTRLRHVESIIVTGLTSHTYYFEFNTAFTETPIQIKAEVYKLGVQSNGTYRRDEINWGYTDNLQPTLEGVEIKINDQYHPDLTGIVIEFKYEEV